jgi:hypothetical protein
MKNFVLLLSINSCLVGYSQRAEHEVELTSLRKCEYLLDMDSMAVTNSSITWRRCINPNFINQESKDLENKEITIGRECISNSNIKKDD